ncbi:hypothetical protein HPB50_012618 [Hyalomma asiaticum]|uniref:Uncharacterized protein n=1 Tax=Hyalomma asiaticum TaxID=266040 RepID=A0ACB7S609_HYAAI|nr:hypothetical protein HPB50_012618 [Hyalomma asiaticum]
MQRDTSRPGVALRTRALSHSFASHPLAQTDAQLQDTGASIADTGCTRKRLSPAAYAYMIAAFPGKNSWSRGALTLSFFLVPSMGSRDFDPALQPSTTARTLPAVTSAAPGRLFALLRYTGAARNAVSSRIPAWSPSGPFCEEGSTRRRRDFASASQCSPVQPLLIRCALGAFILSDRESMTSQ